MRPTASFRVVTLGVLAATLVAGLVSRPRTDQLPVLREPGKLLAAARSYARDASRQGTRLPSEVALSELVATGYLSAEDIAAFAGMEGAISLHANEEQPQSILFWVRGRDGVTIALLGDGSIQQLPAGRFDSLRRAALEITPSVH